MATQDWGADVPVSMPEPPAEQGLVPMYGFVFTASGLFHDLTQAEHERLSLPTYAPMQTGQTVYGDLDVEED